MSFVSSSLFNFLFFEILFLMYVCVHMFVCACECKVPDGGERYWISLELELQSFVRHTKQMLGAKLDPLKSGKHSETLNHLSSHFWLTFNHIKFIYVYLAMYLFIVWVCCVYHALVKNQSPPYPI